MSIRTGILTVVPLILVGFGLLLLGGWLYQTSVAGARHANATCGLNTCVTVEPSPLGIYVEYLGGFMLFVAVITGVYVLVMVRGPRLGPTMH